MNDKSGLIRASGRVLAAPLVGLLGQQARRAAELLALARQPRDAFDQNVARLRAHAIVAQLGEGARQRLLLDAELLRDEALVIGQAEAALLDAGRAQRENEIRQPLIGVLRLERLDLA